MPNNASGRRSLLAKIVLLITSIVLSLVIVYLLLDLKNIYGQKDALLKQVGKKAELLAVEVGRLSKENLKIAFAMANAPTAIKAMSANDRKGLLVYANKVSSELNKYSSHKLRVHFHKPPAISFLRTWKPNKHGDDLSGFRHTVVNVIRTGQPASGIEAGRGGLVIRGIAPIKDSKGKILGSVEVYCSVQSVAKQIAKMTGDENALYSLDEIKATMRLGAAKKVGKFSCLIPPSSKDKESLVSSDLLNKGVKQAASRSYGNTFVSAFPLKDYQGRNVAVFVTFTSLDAINSEISGTIWQSIIIAGVFLVLGLGVGVVFAFSLIKPLNSVIENLGENSRDVSQYSDKLSTASSRMSDKASTQAASLEEIAASLEEVSSMTQRNAEHSGLANQEMKETSAALKKANQNVHDLNDSMEKISQAGGEIQTIVKSIDEISFQTNLLALNAAVEAARAGEAGAGFAVVADEVRSLALRAAEAAKNTEALVVETNQRIEDGASLLEETRGVFETSAESAQKVEELLEEIASASSEQAQGITELNHAINEMDQGVQETAISAEENARVSQDLSQESNILWELVERLNGLVRGKNYKSNTLANDGDDEAPRLLPPDNA